MRRLFVVLFRILIFIGLVLVLAHDRQAHARPAGPESHPWYPPGHALSNARSRYRPEPAGRTCTTSPETVVVIGL